MVAREAQSRRGMAGMSNNLIQQPQQMVKEYPLSSMLVVFGVGLGVGVLLSQTLAEPVMRSFYHEPSMSERWGRSMYDTMSSMVPEAVSRRWSS